MGSRKRRKRQKGEVSMCVCTCVGACMRVHVHTCVGVFGCMSARGREWSTTEDKHGLFSALLLSSLTSKPCESSSPDLSAILSGLGN